MKNVKVTCKILLDGTQTTIAHSFFDVIWYFTLKLRTSDVKLGL